MINKQYREMATNGYSVRHGMYNPVYDTYDKQKVWYYNMGLYETWDVIR